MIFSNFRRFFISKTRIINLELETKQLMTFTSLSFVKVINQFLHYLVQRPGPYICL